jgi:myo-inositol-1(or 4)-monophosphatase
MLPTLDELRDLARQAGEIQHAAYGQDFYIGHKGRVDLVTEIDQRVEQFLIESIRARFPEHQIVAEESGGVRGADADHCWYIDPLDGTVNFAHGVPIFCVSIGFAYRGQVALAAIFDPMRGECFSAERGAGAWMNATPLRVADASDLVEALLVTGFPYDAWTSEMNNLDYFSRFMRHAQAVRRLGSAALDLCYVASGRLDGFWEIKLNSWDIAAGSLIVEEAGGLVTDMVGQPISLAAPGSILAANPAIHAQMLEVIRE